MANVDAVTNEDFEQSVIQAETPVLVDFLQIGVVPARHKHLF